MNWFSRGYEEYLRRLKRKRRRDLFTYLFVWVLAPLLLVFCMVSTCRSHRRSMIHRLEVMQQEKLQLYGEKQELTRALAELSSRKRIYHYATEKLGMKYPEQDEIILVVFDEEKGSDEHADRDQLAGMTGNSRDRSSDSSLINVMTHFFALYVF